MSTKIQFKRGAEANLPILASGEPAWTTDKKRFYIGDGTANHGVEMALADQMAKAKPADADSVPVVDSADNSKTKRVLWSSIKSAIQAALEGIFAKTVTLTCTVPVSWPSSGGFYYQQVSVPGMLATDNPVTDYLPGSDNAANELFDVAWSKVRSIDTLNGAVKFWCKEAPTTAFPVQFKVVR